MADNGIKSRNPEFQETLSLSLCIGQNKHVKIYAVITRIRTKNAKIDSVGPWASYDEFMFYMDSTMEVRSFR